MRLVRGVDIDDSTDVVFVAMTYGLGSDWFQNLIANPGAIEAGGQRRVVTGVKGVPISTVIASTRKQEWQSALMSRFGIDHVAELTLTDANIRIDHRLADEKISCLSSCRTAYI